MKKKQAVVYEYSYREDARYNIWKKVAELASYPIMDGKDTFRYTIPRWIIVDVVVGETTAAKRVQELTDKG